ncbi:MAG TPA: rhodanese-like domain-containing protein [Balneolaceae bacterium]|nr:rhodanese-like domain-containing protein [Balneolaceae bacterium]
MDKGAYQMNILLQKAAKHLASTNKRKNTMFARLMGLKTISPDALHQLMQKPESLTLFDVNSRSSWKQARVPGASNLDPVDYSESDLPEDKDAVLVFYCSNPMCRKAPNAARKAKKLGYGNVQVMSAGINGWLAKKLPTETGE